MANDLNLCQFIGRLGQDPEAKYLTNGDAVVNLSIAVGSQWKDKTTGEKKEATEWVRVVMFRRLAEVAAQYLRKGSKIYVSGKMTTRKYQDKTTGADRYTTEIVGAELQMLDGKPAGDEPQSWGQPAQGGNAEHQAKRDLYGKAGKADHAMAAADDLTDDIPW